jgi:hypothetical protein
MSRVFSVPCPVCKEPAGSSCKHPNGTWRRLHAGRIYAYLATLKDVEDPEDSEDPDEDDSRNSDGNAHQTVNTR